MFICGMVLPCAGTSCFPGKHSTLKPRLESGPVTADMTTTVVHSSKLLINDVKPTHSIKINIFKIYEYIYF